MEDPNPSIFPDLKSHCFLCKAKTDLVRHVSARVCRPCSLHFSSRGAGKLPPSAYIEPSMILPNLFLGPERSSVDIERLNGLGITKILVVSDSSFIYFPEEKSLRYKRIEIKDEPGVSLEPHLQGAFDFLSGPENERSLVHCVSGMSRSAAVVVAYIMRTKGWGFQKSLEFVKLRRPYVCLNPGFEKQIKRLELLWGLAPGARK